VRSCQVCLVVVAVIALTAAVGGCGDSGSAVLTTTDVREAFADQGLSLVVYEDKWRGAHFLAYSADGETRISCFVFDDPRNVRPYMKLAAKAKNDVSRALAARNVVVLLLPEAKPDERRRAVAAVETLR
jgi:hypothetical protein